MKAAWFVCAGLIAVCACAGDSQSVDLRPTMSISSPPTRSGLAARWDNPGVPIITRLRRDGTFVINSARQVRPRVRGTYDLNGRTLTFSADPNSVCGDDRRWVWRVGMLRRGEEMLVVWVNAGCGAVVGDSWTLHRA